MGWGYKTAPRDPAALGALNTRVQLLLVASDT